MNQLYGDNLQVLREHIADESVDFIYLDPPFNSKRDYNLLFKVPGGHDSEAQIEAFEDTWHWNQQAEREFDELLHQQSEIHKIVVSVKGGGNLKADDVRSLMAVREREGADIALFISLEEPTKGMIKDAASAGF